MTTEIETEIKMTMPEELEQGNADEDTEQVTDDKEITATSSTDGNDNDQEFTQEEVQAMARGWKPESEWTGDPDKFKSAKDFNAHSTFFERIAAQKKELRQQQQVIKDLVEHNKKVMEAAYNKALTDLKKQKIDAMESADYATQVEVDEQIEEARRIHEEEMAKLDKTVPEIDETDQIEVPPVYLTWVNENTWSVPESPDYDKEMADTAVAFAKIYKEQGLEVEAALSKIDSQMRRIFPDKFQSSTRQRRGSPVESGRRGGGRTSSKSLGLSSLPEEQQIIAKRIISTTGITEKEYLEQYALIAG